MARDNEFDLEAGPIGQRGKGHLERVLKAQILAGGRAAKSAFRGNRKGRGTGIGRVLASRDHYAAFRSRRIVIKARVTKMAGKGMAAAKAHLRYIQRGGVTREGAPGELYGREGAGIDGKAFLEQAEGDRHQFRFIVSAEDAEQYTDLKPFVRKLMAQMEQDLGTKLDWVAVDHFNTGHPHTHIILRGKDERGRDLLIAREYISDGIRERAAEIVTFDLGPKSDLEIESALKAQVDQERFTGLDRDLKATADEQGTVAADWTRRGAAFQTLRAGRLQKLGRMGLAQDMGTGRWQLAAGWEDTLRRMGERGDIIATMHRALAKETARVNPEYAIFDPSRAEGRALVGKVIEHGLEEEKNRHYLVLDGLDGRVHYVDTGTATPSEPLGPGYIVEVAAQSTNPRPVDSTIAQIAAAHGGHYSEDLHQASDPTASAEFIRSHVRRLEAMRRLSGTVERDNDGTWHIAPDHLERVRAFQTQQNLTAPVAVVVKSLVPVERQVSADGPTWLDRTLLAGQMPTARAGFGREADEALIRRRQWLLEQDLAREDSGQVQLRGDLLSRLRRREIQQAATQIARESGLEYMPVKPGTPITGIYRQRVDLHAGPHAVIENGRQFQLVPWRPVLERNLGKPVSGMERNGRVSWSFQRDRGPTIT